MNFTKDYISLCKNDKVQGLRPEFYLNEWFYDVEMNAVICNVESFKKHKLFWLPETKQVDTIICDRLSNMSRDGEDLTYEITVSFSEGSMSAWQVVVGNRDSYHEELNVDLNLAKLKLLISLLEEE